MTIMDSIIHTMREMSDEKFAKIVADSFMESLGHSPTSGRYFLSEEEDDVIENYLIDLSNKEKKDQMDYLNKEALEELKTSFSISIDREIAGADPGTEITAAVFTTTMKLMDYFGFTKIKDDMYICDMDNDAIKVLEDICIDRLEKIRDREKQRFEWRDAVTDPPPEYTRVLVEYEPFSYYVLCREKDQWYDVDRSEDMPTPKKWMEIPHDEIEQ